VTPNGLPPGDKTSFFGLRATVGTADLQGVPDVSVHSRTRAEGERATTRPAPRARAGSTVERDLGLRGRVGVVNELSGASATLSGHRPRRDQRDDVLAQLSRTVSTPAALGIGTLFTATFTGIRRPDGRRGMPR